MDKTELRTRILLACQTALLGMIDARVRAVTCSWTATRIVVRVVIDGPILTDDEETFSEVETEILSHLPDHAGTVECIRMDAPQPIKFLPNEVIVFKRKEN